MGEAEVELLQMETTKVLRSHLKSSLRVLKAFMTLVGCLRTSP